MERPSQSGAPQSREELERFVAELRRTVDPRMDIWWQPRAVVLERGGFDVMGNPRPTKWDGRWEVITENPEGRTASWRDYTHVCYVTEPVRIGPDLEAMQDNGPYAPVGDWLVAYLQQANWWNMARAGMLADVLEKANAAEDARELGEDQGAMEDAAHRTLFRDNHEGGRSVWFGQGAEFKPE